MDRITELERLGKLIKGLVACLEEPEITEECAALGCPFRGEAGHCMTVLNTHALEYLNKLMPRVLDPKEIPQADGAVWVEDCEGGLMDVPDACLYCHSTNERALFVGRLMTDFSRRWDMYQKTWRVWSTEPTQEMREKEPWANE